MLSKISTQTQRHTVNVTKNRSSFWHINGPWPTKKYFLEPETSFRFADKGDRVECMISTTTTWNYHGLKYTTTEISTDRVVDL